MKGIPLGEVKYKVSIELTSGYAKVPSRASNGAAGYDLYATEDTLLNSMERKLLNTGVKVSIPKGFYGRLAPRSGLALKNGLDVLAGVIDSDYTGEVGVLLINLSCDPITIKTGDRIAQIIFEKCFDVDFTIVDELPKTDRGTDGFGSTGINDEEVKNSVTKRDGGFNHPHLKKEDIKGSLLERFNRTNVDVPKPASYEKQVKEREQGMK